MSSPTGSSVPSTTESGIVPPGWLSSKSDIVLLLVGRSVLRPGCGFPLPSHRATNRVLRLDGRASRDRVRRLLLPGPGARVARRPDGAPGAGGRLGRQGRVARGGGGAGDDVFALGAAPLRAAGPFVQNCTSACG